MVRLRVALPFVLACVWLAAPQGIGQERPGTAGSERTVILVSIDGFAHFYLDDPKAPVPTLRRLAREGAVAERGMECSFPTVTWPNHTTLVTGVPPARHGVFGNNVFDRAKDEEVQLLIDPVFDKWEIVRVPTIYDVAHAAGLKTAGIIWPATRHAQSLDWTVPDMAPQDVFEKYSTPSWLAELRAAGLPIERYGAWVKAEAGGTRRDWMWTQATIRLVNQHRPNLVLLHLIEADHVQHNEGPKTGDAYWSVSYEDQLIRDLRDMIEASPRREHITLIVTSDHGFFVTRNTIQPNVRLRQLGLVRLQGGKVASRDAWVVAQGGSAAVYVRDTTGRAEIVAQLRQELGKLEGVERVVEPSEFAALGQPKPADHAWGADLWLAAREGYSFGGSATADAVVVAGPQRGTHGYLPGHADMHGILIAWGHGVRPGTKLGKIHNTQVAPTVAQLLGLHLPDAEGKPLQIGPER
jgi:predicted AlkP superfamily pyrophosphatase or phosphodiesterase